MIPKGRIFNFIFFVDENPTRSVRFSAKLFYAFVVGSLAIVLTLTSGTVLYYLEYQEHQKIKTLLEQAQIDLFNYKVRYENVYDKAYKKKYSKPETTKTVANEVQPENLATKSILGARKEVLKIESPKTASVRKSEPRVSKKVNVKKNSQFVAFDSIRSKINDRSLSIRFAIRNQGKRKVEGRYSLVARFVDTKGGSHFVPYPKRLKLKPTGDPVSLSKGKAFSIKRFRPINVDLKIPNSIASGGRFVDGKLYAHHGENSVATPFVISKSPLKTARAITPTHKGKSN